MWIWAAALAAEPEAPTWGFGAGAGPWLVVKTPNYRVVPDFDAALAGRVGVAIRPPLWVELEAPLGLANGGLRWAPRAQVAIVNPDPRFRPQVAAGVSLQGASSTDPTVTSVTKVLPHWGLGASVNAGGPWFRVDVRHTIDLQDAANPLHHVVGTLGLEWFPHREVEVVAVEPPPPPAPAPATPPPAFTVTPADEVWVSHPICAWVTAAEAPALIATAPGPVTVVAEGFLPVVVDPRSATDLVLVPAPHGGALVVAVAPGDHVFVDGVAAPVSRAGQVVMNTDAPLVKLRIEGGGRRVETEVAPADGWGVWYRATTLPVLEIRFQQGSAEPGPDAVTQVERLVSLAGDRRYRLQGSYSPEGREVVNQELAQRRAERVQELLVAAGFPPERIEVLPVSPLTSDDPAQARVVLVSSAAPEAP